MAMKVSDVDANQLAEVDANGALGYIVSPDSALFSLRQWSTL
jgi:hypothetical protein